MNIVNVNTYMYKHVNITNKTQHNAVHSSVWTARNGLIVTLIARFMGPTWGPSWADRWAPCWLHELCYLGLHSNILKYDKHHWFLGNLHKYSDESHNVPGSVNTCLFFCYWCTPFFSISDTWLPCVVWADVMIAIYLYFRWTSKMLSGRLNE